ncbi:hypothetical protein [Streptomyces atriruber]|uniref:hypothetical protein n=1 Tax=Streptomyces atriruber TaxID=545121 RepID=UPI0007C75529|nr:hypothetical protein [Streptomyces atriruber]
MSFDSDWASARSAATAKTNMQLNASYDGTGNRGLGRGLKVTSSILNERAGKADTVREDFMKADNSAMKETAQVGPSLKGFESSSAFSTFADRWKGQMTHVESLLKDDVSGALRTSAQSYMARERKEKDRHSREGKDLK